MADRLSDQFVAFLRMAPPERRAAWRRDRMLQWGGVLLAWLWFGLLLFLLSPVAFSSVFSWYDVAPPNLGTACWDILTLLIVPIPILLFTAITVPSKAGWYGSEIVREDLLAGRNSLATVASDQPKPLLDDDAPHSADSFTLLRFPAPDRMMTAIAAIDIILVILMVALTLLFGYQANTPTGAPWLRSWTDVAAMDVPLISLGKPFAFYGAPYIAAFGWWIFLPGRRQKILAVDGWGIRWRERRWRTREYGLAWKDVEAFCVSRYSSERATTRTYLLLGSEGSFAWVISSRAKGAQQEASDLLARLAARNIQRPLLDVTATIDAAKTLAMPLSRRVVAPANSHGPAKTLLAELERAGIVVSHTHSGVGTLPADALPATYGLARRERPLGIGARFYWVNVALLTLVAVGMVSWLLFNQVRSDAYYRALYPRVVGHAPLYRDPLTAADGVWPVQTATLSDPADLGYSNGGYTINGGRAGSNYVVWRGARFRDMAVVATVRPAPGKDFGFVGLAARVQSSGAGVADEVVFDIWPRDGGLRWDVLHLRPPRTPADDGLHYLAGGDVPGVHFMETTATRMLLVVMGNRYLCYINGVFVGAAEDAYAPLSPPTGYAGLFVLDRTAAAVFNDFAVYPAPPPYQPLLGGL